MSELSDKSAEEKTQEEPKNNDKAEHRSVKPEAGRPHMHGGGGRMYYTELIRVVSILYVGVLALMTFLLTAGLQKPHADFSYALYTSIVVLALNLVAYVAGHMARAQFDANCVAADNGEGSELKALEDKRDSSKRMLKSIRIVQNILFVVAVIAVTWLALATAQFFFSIPTTPTSSGQ